MALGIWGEYQVGGGLSPTGKDHALLWNGTADSVTDLNPPGFDSSFAQGIWGTSQVGYGVDDEGAGHALIWNGTAETAVSLNSPGYGVPLVYSASAAGQVGFSGGPATGGRTHALFWKGTAESIVDLHPFVSLLGAEYTGSAAYFIADDGSIVGSAFTDAHQRVYAVLWTPVPEPPSCAFVALGVVAAMIMLVRHSA
jgi:uncharacterized membrane protein